MKTRRLRLVRPRWTLGTMLLVVGWSAVVVWLNVRPRFVSGLAFLVDEEETVSITVEYGFPCKYAFNPSVARLLSPTETRLYDDWAWQLVDNLFYGLLAVAVLTFASKYLVRAIVAGLRAFMSKPPPSNGKGHERAN